MVQFCGKKQPEGVVFIFFLQLQGSSGEFPGGEFSDDCSGLWWVYS